MRILFLATAFIFGGALSAAAQALPTQPTPPAPAVTPSAGATVTAEGCVTRESASPQDAAGAREPAAAMQFVLTQRTPPKPMVPDASAARAAGPVGEQAFARKIYVLVAREGDALDFAKHLNQLVKVTGLVTGVSGAPPAAPPAPMTPAPPAGRQASGVAPAVSTAGATPVGATGTPFGTTHVPTLAVATLEMVSSTCR